MDVNTNQSLGWTLSVFRNAEQGDLEELDKLTQFRFGRFAEEMEMTPVASLSSGLISLVKKQGYEGDALEAGFMVHMTTKKVSDDWERFDLLAGHASWMETREMRRNPRSVYSSEGLEGCVEFVEIHSCSPRMSSLPEMISMRISPLPMPIMAWGFSKGFFSIPKTRQATLGEWVDLPEIKQKNSVEILALPGPTPMKYSFFGGPD